MTTLRVTLDEFVASETGGMSRYAGELARALIATAPADAEIVGMVPASPEPDYARVLAKLPGLARLEKSALAARELSALWRRGLGRSAGTGMLHATSLLAPLGAHDRMHHPDDQLVVTIHDSIAWTHPELLPSRTAAWQRSMAKRAERYADAVVVPSHAVADELAPHLALGDRVRVIPGAPSSSLVPTGATTEHADELGLPEDYLLTVGGTEPKKNLSALLAALAHTDAQTPLVVIGDNADAITALAEESGVADRVFALGQISDPELGVAYLGARAYLQTSIAEGFGLAVLEALAFGVPVVHTSIAALDELTAGAALSVPLGDELPERFAAAIDRVEGSFAAQLATASGDRARIFDWRDSAERVWQLHADL